MNTKLLNRVEQYRSLSLEKGVFRNYVDKELLNKENIAKHIYNTSSIEGNTVTENDTLRILTGIIPQQEAYSKYKKEEIFEIQGMIKAHNYMYNHIENNIDSGYISEQFINDLHTLVYEPVEETHKGIFAGEYRTYPSFTCRQDKTKKYYTDWQFIEEYIEDMIFYYNSSFKTIQDICKMKLEFIHIHPYGDGNGRVSRLLLNWALVTNGYTPIIIRHEEKSKYIDSMDYYGNTQDHSKFTEYICDKLLETYKIMLGW